MKKSFVDEMVSSGWTKETLIPMSLHHERREPAC
uniref:Uncharacterized protein n=1 Tax=Lepeophtheirus salmonis TaxID=72036 RepID=A0A0K2T176_LEPSM